jgi:hypothetical protein
LAPDWNPERHDRPPELAGRLVVVAGQCRTGLPSGNALPPVAWEAELKKM